MERVVRSNDRGPKWLQLVSADAPWLLRHVHKRPFLYRRTVRPKGVFKRLLTDFWTA